MLTNPTAITVLCFGDSNTNGMPSDDEDYVRLAADVRWTGRLQRLLGDGYDIIEEGLNGRTTDLYYGDRDHDDRPGCNGRAYFGPCLRSHHPLDVVVLMLGSNDLKTQFHRSPADIAAALDGYFDDVAANVGTRAGGAPATILVSPILPDDRQPRFADVAAGSFDADVVDKARGLAAELRRVAQGRDALFADAAAVARAGADGQHISLESHAPLAELIARQLGQAIARP